MAPLFSRLFLMPFLIKKFKRRAVIFRCERPRPPLRRCTPAYTHAISEIGESATDWRTDARTRTLQSSLFFATHMRRNKKDGWLQSRTDRFLPSAWGETFSDSFSTWKDFWFSSFSSFLLKICAHIRFFHRWKTLHEFIVAKKSGENKNPA